MFTDCRNKTHMLKTETFSACGVINFLTIITAKLHQSPIFLILKNSLCRPAVTKSPARALWSEMCSFSGKIKLLKIRIYSEFRVCSRPHVGYPGRDLIYRPNFFQENGHISDHSAPARGVFRKILKPSFR